MKKIATSSIIIGGAVLATLALLTSTLGFIGKLDLGSLTRQTTVDERASKTAAVEAFRALPLSFEPNEGQTDPSVDFLARGPGHTTFLRSTEAVLSLNTGKAKQPAVLRMQIAGANPSARVAGKGPLPGKINYLKGDATQWIKTMSTFSSVRYSQIYPGIDLLYYGKQSQLEYDFVVKPGADPSSVKLQFDGADSLALRPNGDLAIQVGDQEVIQNKPYVYQQSAAGRKAVAGNFVINGHDVTFDIGTYNKSQPLVIDPTISYSSFVGGNSNDVGFGVAADGSGNAYLTGSTSSTNFPTKGAVTCGITTSSLQCKTKLLDAYVTKIDTNTTGAASLVWSTYLGGDSDDVGFDVAFDSSGNVYVAGTTQSSDDIGTTAVEAGFPTTANAHDTTCGTDGKCNAPAPDPNDPNCPPAGTGSCPTSPIPDAFVSKLNPSGSALLYSTFLGGADFELEPNPASGALGHMDIAVQGSSAYVASSTASSDFPTTLTGDKTCGIAICFGQTDAFVSVFDTAKSGKASLTYSTYVGGEGADSAKGVAVDAQGNAYVAGTTVGFNVNPLDQTSPIVNNFPNTNLLKLYNGGASDGFITKVATKGLVVGAGAKISGLNVSLTANAGSIIYSTYLGGGGTDEIWDVAVQGTNAYVTGFTDSGDDPSTPAPDGPMPYFPTTAGAYDTSFNGQATHPVTASNSFLNGDAFVTKLKADGTGVAYSTFLGGIAGDVGHGIAVDSTGAAYVAGYTMCENQNPSSSTVVCVGTFPTVNAVQPVMGGKALGVELHNSPTDGFVTKLNPGGSALVYSTFLGGNNFDRSYAIALRQTPTGNEVYVTGRAGSTDFPTTANAFAPTKPSGSGNRDAYVTKISD